jgi:hypothetical protein
MSQSALKIPPIEQSNSNAKERLKKFSPKIKKLPKRKKNSDTETEDEATSDIEFEVGGTIKSSRYKPITFKE